jgi:hypothetical protein
MSARDGQSVGLPQELRSPIHGCGFESRASQDYIQLWQGDANLLRESLEAIRQTAAVILGGIAPEPAALAASAYHSFIPGMSGFP